MADLVGEAYVRITAHGDSRAIRNAVRRAGDTAGRQFAAGFDKSVRQFADKSLSQYFDDLAMAFVREDWSKLRHEGEKVGDTVDRLAASYRALAADGSASHRQTEQYIRALRKWGEETANTEEAADRLRLAQERQSEAFKTYSENIRVGRKGLRGLSEELDRLNREDNDKFVRELAVAIKDVDFKKFARDGEDASEMTRRLRERVGGLSDQFRFSKDDIDLFNTSLREYNDRVNEIKDVDVDIDKRGGWGRAHRRLRSINTELGKVPDLMGRMMGRGARNDFVNLIGAMARGITSLIVLGPRLALSLGAAIGDIARNFTEANRTGQSFARLIMEMIASAFITLGGAVAAAVVGIGLILTALPILVSFLSMAAGAVTVLAGALTYALIGALLPLAPILAGLGAAVAVGIAGFQEWEKAAEGLSGKLRPLKSAWEDLRSSMRETYLPRLIGDLGRLGDIAAKHVVPGLEGIADAITKSIRHFTNLVDSPQIRKYMDIWGEKLPKIMRSFGDGIAEMLVGLGAFFTPILDFAQRLATGFEDMMKRFREWAESPAGQNKIAEFMEKAWEAAKDLWGILGEVWDLLGNLFDFSWDSGGGDTILDSIREWLGGINDWLTDPANAFKIEEWFGDVSEFIDGIGGFIGTIGDLWDTLDNPKVRDTLNQIGDALTGIDWEGVATGVGIMATAFSGFVTGLMATFLFVEDRLSTFVDTIKSIFDGAISAATTGINGLDNIFTALGHGDIIDGSIGDRVREKIGQIGWDIHDALVDVQALLHKEPGWIKVPLTDGSFTWEFYPETAFQEIGSRIANGLKSVVTNAVSGADVLGSVGDAVRTLIDAVNLSVDPGDLARFQDSIETGIVRPFGMGAGNALQILGQMNTDVTSAASHIAGALEGGLSGVPTATQIPFMQATQAAVHEMSGMAEGVGAAVSTTASTVQTALSTVPIAAQTQMAAAKVAAIAESAQMSPAVGAEVSKVPGAVNAALSATSGMARVQMVAARLAARVEAIGLNADVRNETAKVPASVNTAMSRTAAMARAQMTAARIAAKVAAAGLTSDVRSETSKTPAAISSAMAGAAAAARIQMAAAAIAARLQAIALVSNIRSAASGAAGALSAALSGLAGAVASQMGRAVAIARSYAASIRAAISSASGTIRINVATSRRAMATGGMVHSATNALIGESGPEAVIPINRPLHQIDPSVRWMAEAIRGQGKGGSNGGVRIEQGAILVQTPQANPSLVAEATVDRIVARFAN